MCDYLKLVTCIARTCLLVGQETKEVVCRVTSLQTVRPNSLCALSPKGQWK
jgi:hypothetical protein